MALTPVQVRILGCLLEKERTTPDNYPLTMNSLMAACNQSTNRHPVVRLEEPTVSNALLNLRGLNLVRIVYSRSNRADRYRQVLDEELGLGGDEAAVLCVLMLRGPQTASELRARSERLHPFGDQQEVEETLRRLADRDEPLVSRLDRQPGQKENRWAQLLGADLPEPAPEAVAASAAPASQAPAREPHPGAAAPHRGPAPTGAPVPYAPAAPAAPDRLAAMESALDELRADLAKLREDFDVLVRQLT